MFFSNLIKSSLWVVLFFLFSCGLKVNEEAPRAVPMVIPQASLGCSVNIFEQNDSYFQGNASVEDINRFWDCTETALNTFMKHTRGATAGIYNSDELRSFLETYFLDERAVPVSLFEELMNLRVAIMGGKKEVVRKKDLETLLLFANIIRKEMIRMQPYMPMNFNELSSKSETQIEHFVGDATLSLNEIGKFFFQFSGSYRFSSLDSLISQIGDYFSHVQKSKTIAESILNVVDTYKNYKGFIRLFKKTIIFEGDPDYLMPKDFKSSFETISLALDVFVRFKFWQQKYDLNFQDKGLDYFQGITQSFKNLMVKVLEQSVDDTLYFSIMDEWVNLLAEKKWVPLNLEKNSVKNILRPIVKKLFAGQDSTPTGRDAKGLTLTALLRVYEGIDEWIVGQRFLKELFQDNKIILKNDLLVRAQKLKEKLVLENPKHEYVYQDIMWVIKTQRPLFKGDETYSYILFPEGHMSTHKEYSLKFLSQMHWLRCLGRVAIAGYTSDLKPKTPLALGRLGLTMDEFQKLYIDLTEIGIQLKFVFSQNSAQDYIENTDSGSKRFRESNIFMSLSDGGKYAHLDEAVEYFSFLFSIKALSDVYYKEFSKKCGTFLSVDVYGAEAPFIEADCIRSEFFKRITEPENYQNLNFKKSMPRLVNYYNGLTPEELKSFHEKLENAARVHLNPKSPFQIADLESYLMILQYVETAFLKYDLDSNEILDENELDEAFSVFYVVLKEIVDKKMPGLLNTLQHIKIPYFNGIFEERNMIYLIYSYLIYYKKPPTFNKIIAAMELVDFFTLRYPPLGNGIKIKASRMTFFTIMSAMAQSTLATQLVKMGISENKKIEEEEKNKDSFNFEIVPQKK